MLTRGKAKGHEYRPTTSPREDEPEDESEEEYSSVGRRGTEDEEEGLEVLEKLGRFVRRHPLTIMSYASVTTLAFLSGIVFTWYQTGPVNKEEIIKGLKGDFVADVTRRSTSQVIENLQGDFADSVTHNATTAAQKYLEGRLQAAHKAWDETQNQEMQKFNEAFEQKMKNLEIKSQTNLTEFHKNMLVVMDKTLKDKMDEFIKTFMENMDTKLRREMDIMHGAVDTQIDQTTSSLTEKMTEMRSSLSDAFDENLKDVRKVMGDVERKTGRLEKLAEKIDTQQSFLEQVMESKGFMKIDFFGPVIMGMALLEILLFFAVCIFFNRGIVGRSAQQQRRRPDTEVSQVTSPAKASQPSPASLIDTNNSVVMGLCFRNADKDLTRTLGSQLVDGCNDPKPYLKTFVVNSMDDIQHIPACRAALVFVAPDEREMIIEDERYHIGQGLRRHAVQRLLDSRVEVFVVIFNNRKSNKLPPDQFYNPRLGQVDEHAQLLMLKQKNRVFSIQDKIHDHQHASIVAEFNAIFA